MLYKYPQNEFPYSKIKEENKARSKADPEYEIIDKGIFDDDEYFDIFIEKAKIELGYSPTDFQTSLKLLF